MISATAGGATKLAFRGAKFEFNRETRRRTSLHCSATLKKVLMVTICSSLRTRMARHEFGGWLAEDAARICTTREFWQIRRQNKFVFTRQARPSLYLFPISLVLHMSQTALCNPRIHSGKCQSSPKQERSVLAGTESHSCRDVLMAVER